MKSLFAVLFLLISTFTHSQNYTQYVNVFIGTDGTGHTFPGPSMPFGMVQPGPDNRDIGWDYTSGYQYRDTIIKGFSQTRLSGTGISELGDVLLLPFVETPDKSLRNRYVKSSETASPGYYSVHKKDGVRVELTCSERVAIHRYTFPSKEAFILADFQHGLRFMTDSLVLESKIQVQDQYSIAGYCHTKNWVERKYFFIMKFDQPILKSENLPAKPGEKAPKYLLTFQMGKISSMLVKVAFSTVSVEGARRNMEAEIPGWEFDKVRKQAESTWNNYLGRIEIETGKDQKEVFYTALYHFLLQPSNIADVDGKFRGPDDKVTMAQGKAYYSTLSIWDVYRGAFPLLQIIAPERIDGIINSLLLHHKAAGFLPIWTAWGQDNYCMIGNHAIPMILSAYSNGFKGFHKKEAFMAMYETSTRNHINSDWEVYNQFGYYPFDQVENESVSRTLESGYDDWCVAQMALKLRDTLNASAFLKRANYYRNLYDPDQKLMRGKDSRGNWRTPFDPLKATSPMNNPGDFTEANAWQYFWTPAQYDISGLQQLLGGKKAFTKKLDDFFTIQALNPDKYLGQEAMIGQYAHGNEPGHHIPYLYAFSDSPKTGQKYINQIIRNFYKNSPDGLIGNDDCGQMSAWYILSCLGFYPVNPANGEFITGAPQLKKATITLGNGKLFTIEAQNISSENIYSGKVILNGKSVNTQVITYDQIMSGGNLIFEMTNK